MQLWPPVWLPFHKGKKSDSVKAEIKSVEDLIALCKEHFKKINEKQISRAYHINRDAYGDKIRKSGEKYFNHPLQVARIVIEEIPLDDVSVIAALLHDIPTESDKFTISDIRNEFGNTVADIVEGISKIRTVESHSPAHLENYRKLLISLFKDVRIILVKIADRLHNLRTLQYVEPKLQKRMAEDTLEIYAPFAHRFGMGRAKWELEDLSFKFINPQAYKVITDYIRLGFSEREDYIKNFTNPIIDGLNKHELLKKHNITFEISGRPKHIYSIYNKTIIRDKPVEELYDLFAIRIILNTDDSDFCFVVYAVISELYKEVPETFKNYIANPKKNGYQSLHIAFYGEDNNPVEVQIRTKSMHDIAEKGVAAHFNYKPGLIPTDSVVSNKNIEEWMESVRTIFEAASNSDSANFLEDIRINLQLDEIYVFTPTDEFRVLPKDATPLDFAYAIHSDLGNSCIGAKINGRIVPLNYKLTSGERVEILTSKNTFPKKEWLNYVITTKARTVILKFLKEKQKEKVSAGTSIWNKIKNNLPYQLNSKEFKKLLQIMVNDGEDEFFVLLAEGSINQEMILEVIEKYIVTGINKNTVTSEKEIKDLDLQVSFPACCYPVKSDKIQGIIDKNKNISVHRSECRNLKKIINEKHTTLFNITWQMIKESQFISKFKIIFKDSADGIPTITSVILRHQNLKIKGINFESKENQLVGLITVSLKELSELDNLFAEMNLLDGIKSVERTIE